MDHSKLLEIGIQKRNKQIDTSWQELADIHSNGLFSTGESYRCWTKTRLKSEGKIPNVTVKNETLKDVAELPNYKEEISINGDGSQSSNKLVRMSIEECKDAEYLLKAHGYDPKFWELTSAKNNIWNSYSKVAGIMTLYASKISVRPATNNISYNNFIDYIKNIKPIELDIEKIDIQDKRMLEIPLYDSHFGVSDYEHYKPTQCRISEELTKRRWEQVLFIIGQDLFHNDDFRGRTSNSTPIEQVDMEKAWDNCRKFYEPLIRLALKNSNSVKIMYSKGNHDESTSWAFVQVMKAYFPDVTYDDSFIERKAHTFGDVFIGVTHGDKARKNLHNLFPVEFPEMWAKAKTREVHIGHLHVEDGRDYFGMMVRTLATRNKTDKWHKDNGFVGAHKRFMLFEYSEQELESIHYV